MPKLMTRSEAESKRRRAVEMLRRFGNDEDADRFESMSPEDYASHKGAEIISGNPNKRCKSMAGAKSRTAPTRAELEDRISELESELEDVEEERDALAEQVEQIEEVLGVEVEEEEEPDQD